ncbi:MAG: ABC transporter ATP-binding protein [Holophagales bacterium]|nr:ABC transporter ATP-binding protein [Holophagales bacterium]
MAALLEIRDLHVALPTAAGEWLPILRGVSLDIGVGEVVGLIGESGSGKSMLTLAALGLLPPPCAVRAGSILWQGENLLGRSAEEMRRVRGRGIALVPQEPAAALTPVATIGAQLTEVLREHRRVSGVEARRLAVELLDEVALSEPERRLLEYPHQLSGGQRQRVLLALALAGRPALVLADEPTAALDATLQSRILDALVRLRDARGLSILLVSHDLTLVAERCDRVFILYAGEVVELASSEELATHPLHPYSRALWSALPRAESGRSRGPLPTIPGQVPPVGRRPSGCAFHPRCGERLPRCSSEEPPWREAAGRGSRCWLPSAEPGCGP